MQKTFSDLTGKDITNTKRVKIRIINDSKLCEEITVYTDNGIELDFDELPKELKELFDDL